MTDAAWLRSLPGLTGAAPVLDLVALPTDPVALFDDWISNAVARGVAEPHAMTLATVDAEGMPDARTLILKGVSAQGWAFASHRNSAKAHQLAENSAAALSGASSRIAWSSGGGAPIATTCESSTGTRWSAGPITCCAQRPRRRRRADDRLSGDADRCAGAVA